MAWASTTASRLTPYGQPWFLPCELLPPPPCGFVRLFNSSSKLNVDADGVGDTDGFAVGVAAVVDGAGDRERVEVGATTEGADVVCAGVDFVAGVEGEDVAVVAVVRVTAAVVTTG